MGLPRPEEISAIRTGPKGKAVMEALIGAGLEPLLHDGDALVPMPAKNPDGMAWEFCVVWRDWGPGGTSCYSRAHIAHDVMAGADWAETVAAEIRQMRVDTIKQMRSDVKSFERTAEQHIDNLKQSRAVFPDHKVLETLKEIGDAV